MSAEQEYAQGYREQIDWLSKERPDLPSAQRCLRLRTEMTSRLVGDQDYNLGGNQATREYVAKLTQ